MGNEQIYPIKIFCFGNQDNILQKIFPEINKTNTDIYEKRILKKSQSIKENESQKTFSINIEWRATLYPDITEENINDLFDDLTKKMEIPKEYEEKSKENDFNDSSSREKSKNIIIKFGKKNSEYIINYMDDIPKTHLPQIAIITDEEFDENHEGLEDNRYLTIIKNVSRQKLLEFLWEKECYYNERGSILLNSYNDKIETNNYINIMLTGLSRSGKSTLINVLSQKLVTLESPFLESVTNHIREYKVITSSNGIFQTGIKFFDTPGLTIIEKNKKRNTINEVKSAINKKMKECKDIREDIHLIYFMLKSIPNLENYVEFFRYLIELNKQRQKEGKRKIYIIFIFNGSLSGIENSMLEYLRDNKLEELIEVIKDKDDDNNNTKKNYLEKYAKKNKLDNNKKKLKNNIIRVNLIKEENSNVYGIDMLLKLTLYFLKKENPFDEIFFNKLEEYKLQLEDKVNPINESKRVNIEEKVNIIIKELSMKNSFLSSIRNINDIKAKAEQEYKIDLCKFLLEGYLGLLTNENDSNQEFFVSDFIDLFRNLSNNYKIFTDEIILIPEFEKGKKKIKDFIIKYSPENFDKKIANNHEKKETMEEFRNITIKPDDIFINGESIYKNLSFKSLIVGFLVDKYSCYIYFSEKIKLYFEQYLRDTCCIKYILRQKEIYLNIFQEMEEMQKKVDWDVFKAKKL